MDTAIYLARHGETERSEADVYYGRSSSPLTALGKRQSELLAHRLRLHALRAIYSSPLDRCIYLAELVATPLQLTPIVVPELTEIDHGQWEGLSRQEVEARHGTEYVRWTMDPASASPSGGESGYAVASRVIPIVASIAERHRGESVLLVGHNTVNRIVLCHYLGLSLMEYRNKVVQMPTALNQIVFRSGFLPRVTLLNDTAHLMI
jgi:probable phosphoglycerate mutase